MSLASILFLFLTHLGIGIASTLLLVPRAAGVKFFRFNAALALTLLVVGLRFRPLGWGVSTLDRVALWGVVGSAAALLIYWSIVGRALPRWRTPLMWAATLAGAAAIVAQALGVVPQDMWRPALAGPSDVATLVRALTVVSFLTSAALLGGACTAMILGHWYLILPSMDVALLQRIVGFHIVSLGVRVFAVGAVVWIALAAAPPESGPAFSRYITSVAGVFFWQRVLFGLAGPALLAFLTWETAKIRSTQSATGILYVDFFTVIVGEVLAKYLLVTTGAPL